MIWIKRRKATLGAKTISICKDKALQRTWSLRGVVLRTATTRILRPTCLAWAGMMTLTTVQHTLHTYCHASFHQDQGLDHFPLCIQVFHLSHKAGKHCIHPEEQGKNLAFTVLIVILTTVFSEILWNSAPLCLMHASHLAQSRTCRSSSVSIVQFIWISMELIYSPIGKQGWPTMC